MEAILILSFIAFVFIVRLFGAWMLHIDELITGQEKQSDLMMTIIKKLGDDPENNREKQEG